MQIQPRQQILDIWRHTARVSYHDGDWVPGGRDGSNSISDAEQLLCVMGPATEIPNRLFECGWSWGPVKGAPPVETSTEIGLQREGVAESAPYLYFTTVALDAIEALWSERTPLLGLLDQEQSRLAGALQLRFELTRSYWATVATFGSGRRPLEDLPWRTVDGLEADYYSLLVAGMVMQNMAAVRPSDDELRRVGSVLEELANRNRITRRPTVRDQTTGVHHPGIRFPLIGSENAGAPRLSWTVTDISPLLLKRTLTLAALTTQGPERSRLLDLSGDIWQHLRGRIIHSGAGSGLWGQPGARAVRSEQPGVAVAVAEEVLRKLDRLSAARRADGGPG